MKKLFFVLVVACSISVSFAQTLTCPTGQTKTIVPTSPTCILRANVKGVQDTDFTLTGYEHLAGECTLSSVIPQAPQTASNQISVTAGLQRTAWAQSSPWAFQLDAIFTCPAGAVKKTCAFTSGTGPLGEIVCACYPAGVTPPATVQEPTYTCVENGCAEGQYWCANENLCKPAGQSCGAVTCNNNNTCETGESCNCADCTNGGTDDKDRCGLTATGAQMACTKDVKNTTTTITPKTEKWIAYSYPGYAGLYIYLSRVPAVTTVGTKNFIVYPNERMIYAMPKATFLADPVKAIQNAEVPQIANTRTPHSRLQFNFAQLFSEPFTTQSTTIDNLDSVIVNRYLCTQNMVSATSCHVNNGGAYLPSFGYTLGGDIYVSRTDSDGYVAFSKAEIIGTFDVPISFDIDRAQANFDTLNNKLATYLSSPGNLNVSAGEFGPAAAELQITQDTRTTPAAVAFSKEEAWDRVRELLSIPGSAEVLWSKSSTKYSNNSLGANERYFYSYVIRQSSGVQKQFFFATEFLPGYGWRKVYMIGKDFPLSTTTGTEVCQNFKTPKVLGNPLAQFRGPEQFCLEQGFRGTTTIINTTQVVGWITQWNAAGTGWEPNQNGIKVDEIKCCGIPTIDSTCQAYKTSNVSYIPNTSPLTQGWLNINGIGTAQNDAGKLVWQVNDAGTNNGNAAVIYKKLSSVELNDFFTNGGKLTAQIKNISASAPTSSAAGLLASYLEIARGKNTTKGEKRFTFVFGLDVDKTPTVIGLTDDGTTYVAPTNSAYQYKIVGGANQYNTYEMIYDPASDTVDLFINGVERISNFPGNTVDPGYAAQVNGSALVAFGSGSSPGVANTNYGDIILSIKDPTCTKNFTQVGACCPAGAQWDSSQNKCAGSTIPVVPGCAEGQYFCSAENKCKLAGATCNTPTCNNNNVCDANESCDCADCNDVVDHCGLDTIGQQMICTKDTAPVCYTDKFPYCLPACLNGQKLDPVTGQCSNFVGTTNTSTATTTSPTVERWIAYTYPGLAGAYIYLTKLPASTYTMNGKTFLVYDPTRIIRGTSEALFMLDPVTAIKNAPEVPIAATRNSRVLFNIAQLQSEDVTTQNTTIDGLQSLVYNRYLCTESMINAGTCNNNSSGNDVPNFGYTIGGNIYVSGSGNGSTVQYALGQILGTFDVPVAPAASTGEQWIAYVGPYYIYLSRTPVETNTVGGQTFYVYNPEKVIPLSTMSKAQFLANPTTAIKNAPLLPVGTAPLASRNIFNLAQLQSESATTQNSTLQNITNFITYRYLCRESKVGSTNCSYNNELVFSPGTGTTLGGDIYAPATGDNTYIFYTKAEKLGTFTLPDAASCQNFTYPIEGNGFVKNDTASVTKYCTQKSFTSGTVVSTDSNGAGTSTWNGTAWTFSGASQTYSKEVQCCGGTVSTPVCQSYPHAQAHGGYLHIGPPSLTQFCKESGFDYASLKSWYMESGSLRVWNGTSWYEDITGGAVQDMQCCKNPTTTTATTTTSSTVVPQLGACCPPGSAWNSKENRCIPTTCGEGQFYCAAQKKCLAGGTTCDTTVCNNDGVCSGEESCQCGDCVDAPTQTDPAKKADDKDKCSIINGKQATCSDDNLTDNKPGACCIAPKKWNTATNTCAECTTTQAPTELQVGLDKPYITCTGNGDTTKTHFKYRLTPSVVSATNTAFTSEIFPVGTQVLHSTPLPLGSYTVECFYGNSTTVDTSTTATPNSCTKNIDVKNTAQGCSRVYAYRGNTLSDEMTGDSSFDASFRCGSRLPSTGFTNPFALRFGTQNPAYLDYDPVYSLFLDYLGVGPLSTQTNNYTVPTGTTNISCAVKIGTGYSTNNACNLSACVGGACSVPQTFSVVSSGNATCTTKNEEEYNIGCNPDAPETTRIACAAWFSNLFAAQTSAGVKTFKAKFTFNGANDEIGCTKYAPGSMPGGINMYENYVCKKILPSGQLVEIYAADNSGTPINSLQTTSYTVRKDNEKPDLQEIKYYTDATRVNLITDITKWQKGSITAQINCLDRPLDESTACACAPDVDPSSSDADKWSVGTPDVNLGADVMYYTRVLTGSVSGQTVRVHDTADNKSDAVRTIDIGIDGQAPVVNVAESGTGSTKTIVITATDTVSKIWKTTDAPAQSTNTNGIIFRKIPKADAASQSAFYDESCGISSPNYATVTETKNASYPVTAQATITGVNLNTDAITYCIEDNAGNVTRGIYPSDPVGCFSSSNMTTIPTITTYKTPLQTAMTANQYGYSLSENASNATCFRGILSNNITTLVTNQYNPSTNPTLNWSVPATLKNDPSKTNTNGYYYFGGISGNTLSINATPTGTGSKAVIVEGGNIQINSNIDYSGTDKTLILIARKNTTTNIGGNIYINPSVTRIDAIIIADGALINATTTGTTTTTKNWIDNPTELNNRLTINGRIYSFNTRGGSFNNDLTPVTANGKYFIDSTLKTDGTPAKAASMDLEGFRLIKNDGNLTCPLSVSYRLFTSSSLPRLLQRPSGYTGGTCGF